MYGAACGELIARMTSRSNVQDRAGAGTLWGLPGPSAALAVAGYRARWMLIDTLRRRPRVFGRVWKSAWEEDGWESVWGVCRKPWKGENPREHPAVWRPNQVSGRQGFSRGSKPRNRGLPGRPVASATEATAGKTVSGFIGSETPRYLVRGVSSEGWIPRALPVWNKTGADLEGVSRAEGSQTLNAEVGGRGKPVWTGPPSLSSAVGSESPWEEPCGFGRSARVRWDILRRRAKLEERIRADRLTVIGGVRRQKNRIAEEMANGKAGPPNQ